MKITILSIGKFSKNDPNFDLFLEYQKRLKWKLELKELVVKGNLEGVALKAKEAEILLNNIPESSKIIALDERGKIMSSPEFANQIKDYANRGSSNLTFIIGGADGLSDEVRKKADLILSFGKMTFPHMMIRAFLSEQLYRAWTIINGHPYHRD